MKKYIYIGVMGSLTFAAANACNWQYNRYIQSLKKWDRIDTQFAQEFSPPSISIQDLLQLNTDQNEYFLYQVKGVLDDKFYNVWRYNEGRAGVQLCGILKDKDQGVVVNLGWVPEDLKNLKHDLAGKEIEIMGILRKPEFKDYHPHKEYVSYIDLDEITKSAELSNNKNNLFLERVGEEDQPSGLISDLYPVPVFRSQINKPYLTPDKHQSYSLFWGCCTILGIYTISKASKF